MKRTAFASSVALVLLAVGSSEVSAQSTTTTCIFDQDKLQSLSNVNLVALLQNAPRTKVTLSIDGKNGFHREIVWDPAVGDGLKHDVLLPADTYSVLAYAEEDRVQTGSLVMTKTTQFKSCRDDEIPPAVLKNKLKREMEREGISQDRKAALQIRFSAAEKAETEEKAQKEKEQKEKEQREKDKKTGQKPENGEPTPPEPDEVPIHKGCRDYVDGQGLLVSTQQTLVYTSTMHAGTEPSRPVKYNDPATSWRPKIRVLCEREGALELAKVPLAKKQLFAASVARGFLDQTAPTLVTDTLAILTEIAMDRAKTRAMELVKERFVEPICDDLDLELLGLGNEGERALPRACALLENMRLQDLLSSGRNLLEAARDDIRLTLVPRIVARLDVPATAQDIAVLALDLGNKLIDGGGSEIAEIDLLFTQLDRLFRRGTVGSFSSVNTHFVRETFNKIKAELGDAAYDRLKEQFLREVLQRVLPQDPGEWLSTRVRRTTGESKLAKTLRLDVVDSCKRPKDDDKTFIPADRKLCINKLIEHFRTLPEWGKTDALFESLYGVLPAEQLVSMVSAIASKTLEKNFRRFSEWLESYAGVNTNIVELAKSAKKAVPDLLRRSCAVRVTLAVVKWCSGRDTCTASDIAAAMDRPETLFGPATSELENLCWDTVEAGAAANALRLPTIRTPYVELATRALAFLTPAAKGEERKRIRAMLRWTFDLTKTLDENRASSLQKLEEILELFESHDYVRAIGQTLALARCSDTLPTASCSRSTEMKKAMEFLGVVASYLQVYDETKTADPAEAKAARKKAIETLIDSSTDRRERARDLVLAIGSNVGFGSTWTDQVDVRDDRDHEYAFRVPLGLSLQYLPRGRDGAGYIWKWVGLHVGFQVADLGQFVRPTGDDDITWSSFVAPGLEAGFLIGEPNRTLALTAHASYVPSLTDDSHPSWRLGLAISYYVPFFDLN
jgi:hypothetical protein